MKFFKRHRRFLLGAAATVFMAALFSLPTEASLMLAPKRVVFDGRTRSATLAVVNTSRETRTFQLGWKMVLVDENGMPRTVPLVEGPHSVSRMVVFSPRRVTIPGNGRQSVRLSLRRPADLPAGEYRGHLVFSSSVGEEEQTSIAASRGASIGLKIGIGMSIPVIVRQGDISPEAVSIQGVSITSDANGAQTLQLALTHEAGKGASAYGNVSAYVRAGEGKEEKIVARSPNVSLYPEQAKRAMRLNLMHAVPSGSVLRIVYEGGEEYSGQTLAQKTIRIK